MYINPTFIENLKYSDALPEYWIISIDQETEILQDVGRCRNRGHPGLVQTLIPGPAVTNPPPINAPPQV